MKRNNWFIISCITIIVALSVNPVKVVAGEKNIKKHAEVNKYQGIYIFNNCRPSDDYDELGSVEKKGLMFHHIFGLFALNSYPREKINIIIRRAKKNYPECDGVIFDNIQMNHAICIKFK